MSRYLLLFILTAPIITAAITNALVRYKLKRIGMKRFILECVFWTLTLAGIGLTKFIYQYMFSNNLTQSEPLSLFDVFQITAIIILMFTIVRVRAKQEFIEKRLQDLHQELSIQLSDKNRSI